jgi:hypothetical protein
MNPVILDLGLPATNLLLLENNSRPEFFKNVSFGTLEYPDRETFDIFLFGKIALTGLTTTRYTLHDGVGL